jgi:hypothetical protein
VDAIAEPIATTPTQVRFDKSDFHSSIIIKCDWFEGGGANARIKLYNVTTHSYHFKGHSIRLYQRISAYVYFVSMGSN